MKLFQMLSKLSEKVFALREEIQEIEDVINDLAADADPQKDE